MMLKEKLPPQFIYPAMKINMLLALKHDFSPCFLKYAYTTSLFAVCD